MSADHSVATDHLSSFFTLEQAADVLAGEQSSGTLTKVALESEELARSHRAWVLDIAPTGARDRVQAVIFAYESGFICGGRQAQRQRLRCEPRRHDAYTRARPGDVGRVVFGEVRALGP